MQLGALPLLPCLVHLTVVPRDQQQTMRFPHPFFHPLTPWPQTKHNNPSPSSDLLFPGGTSSCVLYQPYKENTKTRTNPPKLNPPLLRQWSLDLPTDGPRAEKVGECCFLRGFMGIKEDNKIDSWERSRGIIK